MLGQAAAAILIVVLALVDRGLGIVLGTRAPQPGFAMMLWLFGPPPEKFRDTFDPRRQR